jgi:hypothetical protein
VAYPSPILTLVVVELDYLSSNPEVEQEEEF